MRACFARFLSASAAQRICVKPTVTIRLDGFRRFATLGST
jgi:hypothetical protein